MSSFRYYFDAENHAAFDLPAKLAVSGWLVGRGNEVAENPDSRGIDLIVSRSGQWVANIEVETRTSWQGSVWRFPTVQTSYRKHRLRESGNWLATLNRDNTSAILTNLGGPCELTKKTVGPRGEELFLNFPTGSAKVFLLN